MPLNLEGWQTAALTAACTHTHTHVVHTQGVNDPLKSPSSAGLVLLMFDIPTQINAPFIRFMQDSALVSL